MTPHPGRLAGRSETSHTTTEEKIFVTGLSGGRSALSIDSCGYGMACGRDGARRQAKETGRRTGAGELTEPDPRGADDSGDDNADSNPAPAAPCVSSLPRSWRDGLRAPGGQGSQ
jgi:hypothetical protein